MRLPRTLALLLLVLAACVPPREAAPTAPASPSPTASVTPAPAVTPTAAPVFLRVNQVGFFAHEAKAAYALTNADLSGLPFALYTNGGEAVFRGAISADRGPYGDFAHLYVLDFSAFNRPGAYALAAAGQQAPVHIFADAGDYAHLLAISVGFFRFQRCGNTAPAAHPPCHLNDALAANGPFAGQLIDATGGWHDAGDYLKFVLTTGYSLDVMLTAYQRHPAAFAPIAADFMGEMRVGLDWLRKMWDADHGVLYFQVGDADEHDAWQLPEANPNPRPAFAAEAGRGANLAGKAAAAFALAAVLWNDPHNPAHDPALAADYLQAARSLYAFGQRNPAAQPSRPADFYDETSWQDDMALAAAELYRATGEARYLQEARQYAQAAGAGGEIGWGSLHGLAHYEIARLDPTYTAQAAAFLQADLEPAQAAFQHTPFGTARDPLYWGVFEAMAGHALEAFWYADLTGDDRYLPMALAQRDYILGRNPWGVCFVAGAGETSPQHPHHQIADLLGLPLTGFWDEGPVPQNTFEQTHITLTAPDPFAAFQTAGAVYHDDMADYVTNEPTISMNATGVALTAWLLATGQ